MTPSPYSSQSYATLCKGGVFMYASDRTINVLLLKSSCCYKYVPSLNLQLSTTHCVGFRSATFHSDLHTPQSFIFMQALMEMPCYAGSVRVSMVYTQHR